MRGLWSGRVERVFPRRGGGLCGKGTEDGLLHLLVVAKSLYEIMQVCFAMSSDKERGRARGVVLSRNLS